jgi:four helix bundle protein
MKEIKERCFEFSLSIIKYIQGIEVKKLYYSVFDQLLRSSTSIGANVIEGKSAHSKKDFIKFYEIALKSANETKYWLMLIEKGLKIDKEETIILHTEADEIAKILATIIIKTKSNK